MWNLILLRTRQGIGISLGTVEGFFGQSDSVDGGGVFGVFGEGSGVCGEKG